MLYYVCLEVLSVNNFSPQQMLLLFSMEEDAALVQYGSS